jgi:hypothetical protein
MAKRMILAIVVVFIAWSVMDYILHGLLLRPTYEATASLWRPMDQMNMPLIYLVSLIFTACFVSIYGLLVGQKSLASGIQFGALFGLAMGITMGFGSYSYLPIPVMLAWSWLFGSLIKAIAAGAIAGLILKP